VKELLFFHPHHRFTSLTTGGDVERSLAGLANRFTIKKVDKAKIVAFKFAQSKLQAHVIFDWCALDG
jgi:hypothetical protein